MASCLMIAETAKNTIFELFYGTCDTQLRVVVMFVRDVHYMQCLFLITCYDPEITMLYFVRISASRATERKLCQEGKQIGRASCRERVCLYV